MNIPGSRFTFDFAGNATGGTVTAMTVYLHNGTAKMHGGTSDTLAFDDSTTLTDGNSAD